MSTQQAQANFGDLVGSLSTTKEAVVVEEQGKPVAVLVDPAAYERLTGREQRARRRMLATIDRIGERNRDLDPDAELAFITEEVEAVRRERDEREQAETKGDR
jgi:prevent-host-death family protein